MSFADELGCVCSKMGCGLRDFLPFACERCGGRYCLAHRSYAEHDCVAPPPGPSASASGTSEASFPAQYASFECTRKGCGAVELVPVACDRCGSNFCFKHRHPGDHECVEAPVPAMFVRRDHTPLDPARLGVVPAAAAAAAKPAAATKVRTASKLKSHL